MARFVDHLQILPVPSRGGPRPPDGAYRPSGLGMAAIGDLLAARGWTARFEDLSFDKPMPPARLAEAYARSIGDAVLSAWDRDRFPIVLSLAHFSALGVGDAFGPELGVVWVSPRGEYEGRGLLRRAPLDRSALAILTGRVGRDKLAVAPRPVPGGRIVLLGGERAGSAARRALDEDAVRAIPADRIGDLPAAVAAIGAPAWYLHVDAGMLGVEAAPAADEPEPRGAGYENLAAALGAALEGRALRAIAVARYDLNRDGGDATAGAIVALLDRILLAAGGEPDPSIRGSAGPAESRHG